MDRQETRPRRSRAPRSRRHGTTAPRARPPGTSAALGPAAPLALGAEQEDGGQGKRTPHSTSSVYLPALPLPRAAPLRGSSGTPDWALQQELCQAPWAWRARLRSCSCFGALECMRTARCVGAQGQRVGGGCLREGPRGGSRAPCAPPLGLNREALSRQRTGSYRPESRGPVYFSAQRPTRPFM